MKDLIEKIGKFEYDIDNEKLIIKNIWIPITHS